MHSKSFNLSRLIAFVCSLSIIISSCKKDELIGPEIQTISVTALSPTKVVFTGKVLKTGNSRVIDHGFVYSYQQNVDDKNGIKISLGNSVSTGDFSREIDTIRLGNYGYSSTMYSRAYLTDERGTAFGQLVATALPLPSAGAISPMMGKSGDVVKINGKFYSPSVNNVRVTFQGVQAKVLSATDTEISAEVPSGMNARHSNSISVVVNIGSVAVTVSNSFVVLAHIKDFSPKSGAVGSIVTFSGDNMPSDYYYANNISVAFGAYTVNVPYYNYNLQATVPYNVKDKVPISITLNGVKTALPGEFTVLAPEISSISPETLMPGMSVTITGMNFPTNVDANQGYPKIKLGNGEYVNISSYYSQTQCAHNIPLDTEEGEYTLTMKVGAYEITAPKKLKVIAYSAKSFSPEVGGPGREVNISGNFIKDQGYYVYFGTQSTWGSATSATNLRINVPAGVNAGDVKVSVDLAGKRVTIPGTFKIIGPSISSFSPLSGVAGTVVTIKGAGFANEYSTVKFGTIVAPIISANDNTITVAVPSNLNLGAMKLTVVTNGQTIVSDANFTATN